MASLAEIRNKIIIKAGRDPKNLVEDSEQVTQRVLAPLCALDIAYGMWQEIDSATFKHETRMYYNRISRMWNVGSSSIFNVNGLLYRDMTEDEIILFSDYTDKLSEHIDQDLKYLYYFFNGSLMDMPTKERDICTKLLVISVIAQMAAANMQIDLYSKFYELEAIGKLSIKMASAYRQDVLKVNDIPISFLNNKQFEKTLTMIWNKLLNTPIQ